MKSRLLNAECGTRRGGLALRILLCAVVPLCLCASVHAQGVVITAGTQPRTEVVGQPTWSGPVEVVQELATIPEDDAGKWQLLVFTGDGCKPCERLKADLATDANLKALADWADLWVYSTEQKSQQFRYKEYEVKVYPTIVLTTPPTSKRLEYVQVCRQEGYTGPESLTKRLVTAIRDYQGVVSRPRPSPDKPEVSPDPTPVVTPPLPNFPPEVRGVTVDLAALALRARSLLETYWLWLVVAVVVFLIARSRQATQASATATASTPSTTQQAATQTDTEQRLEAIEKRLKAVLGQPPKEAAKAADKQGTAAT